MPRTASSLFALWIACLSLSAQPRPIPRLIQGPIRENQRVRFTGHVHPMATAANDVGVMDSSETLPAITMVLRQTSEQQADLDRLLTAQQDPSSPDYHRWLTPEQFAERF